MIFMFGFRGELLTMKLFMIFLKPGTGVYNFQCIFLKFNYILKTYSFNNDSKKPHTLISFLIQFVFQVVQLFKFEIMKHKKDVFVNNLQPKTILRIAGLFFFFKLKTAHFGLQFQ